VYLRLPQQKLHWRWWFIYIGFSNSERTPEKSTI